MSKNKFINFRNWLENDISNMVKKNTGNDLFDWVSIFLVFGGGSSVILVFFLIQLIDVGAMLQAWVLWFTAFVIIRYTKETYHLKKLAQKELEQLKVAEMNKMMPIILFEEGARLHKGGNLAGFRIWNEGQGIAKDISVILASFEIERNFSLAPKNQRDIRIGNYLQNVVDAINQNPDEINMEIRYKDIYERRFRAVEITFTRDDDGNYNLDRGKWKFQILD